MTAHAAPVPVRVRDVAQVAIGGEIRTGSASENGHEGGCRHGAHAIGSNILPSTPLKVSSGTQTRMMIAWPYTAGPILSSAAYRRDAQLETEIMI